MLGIEPGSAHGALEVKTEPFLNSTHTAALGKIEKEHEVEDNGRGEDAVSTQKVYFNLHRIAQSTVDIDIVPAFLVVAPRWVVVNPHLMGEVLIKVGVELRLENLVQDR